MKSKFSFIFSILFCSALIEANISVEHLNNELKKDYFFVERSLNQSDLKIESSQGKITYDESKPDGTPLKKLDISKALSYGWKSKISLKNGIKSTYNWALKNIF